MTTTSPVFRRAMWIATLYITVCLIINFLPRHGPPSFRYTGSDPSIHVWNFGWPLAVAIYDARNGWHTFDLIFLFLFGGEFFVAVAAMTVVALVARRSRQGKLMRPGFPLENTWPIARED